MWQCSGVRGQIQKTNTKSVDLTTASDISCVLLRRNLNVKHNYMRLLSGSSVQLRRDEIELFMWVLHQTGRDETLSAEDIDFKIKSNHSCKTNINTTTTASHSCSWRKQWHLQLFVTQWWSCKALTKNNFKHLYWLVGEIQFTFISIAHYIIQTVQSSIKLGK